MIASDPLGTPVDPTPARRPQRIVLDGRYVRIEPIDAARHGAALYAASHGPDKEMLWRYLPETPFPDARTFQTWLEPIASSTDPLAFALIDKDHGDTPAGMASYLRIEPGHRVIEIGWIWFGATIARSRVATEAMYLFMRHAFEDLGYRRYEWKCNDLNEPSKRAALRLGFTYEGLFRRHMILKGHNRDTAWFSILDEDWPALRHAYDGWLDPANFDAHGQQRRRLADFSAAGG